MIRIGLTLLYVLQLKIHGLLVIGVIPNLHYPSSNTTVFLCIGTFFVLMLWMPYKWFLATPGYARIDNKLWKHKWFQKFAESFVGKRQADDEHLACLKKCFNGGKG